MIRADAVRLVAQISQCEIALVRRDGVAGPLLSQAARAADGLEAGPALEIAARLARGHDAKNDDPSVRARHKAIQALTRLAAQQAQEAAF